MIDRNSMGKCPRGSFSYTIRSGDTLYKLAQRYNTTVEDIMRLNPGINPKNLQIGQMICIPKQMQRQCPRGTFEYTIKSGDTFYFLSIRYNTTVEEIMAMNPGVAPENLQIGQKVCIPEASFHPKRPDHRDDRHHYWDDRDHNNDKYYREPKYPDDKYYKDPKDYRDDEHHRGPKEDKGDKHHKDECKGSFYIIKAGDTLYEIANRYNVRVSEILKENPDLDPNNLKVGQLVCIPDFNKYEKRPIRKPYKY